MSIRAVNGFFVKDFVPLWFLKLEKDQHKTLGHCLVKVLLHASFAPDQ